MGRLPRIAVTMSAALVGLLGAAHSASAAPTVYGRECAADSSYGGARTLTAHLAFTEGVPVSGVITSWQMNATGYPASLTQRLKVVADSPKTGEPTVIAESAIATVLAADAGVPTRLPVGAGDLIGLASQEGGEVLYCAGRSMEDSILYSTTSGDVPVGGNVNGSGLPGLSLPVQVTIEPDADGDGYGDETQDSCPTNPLLQSCPTVAPAAPPAPVAPAHPHPLALAIVHAGSVTVKVSSDIAAAVTVTSRVPLGKGSVATPRGGSKTLAAGGSGTFTLKFPKALTEKLAALPRKRRLKLHVTVTATSAAGPIGTKALTVNLRGRAR